MHVITLLLIEWLFISIINCACYSVTYTGTRPLNDPITLCYGVPEGSKSTEVVDHMVYAYLIYTSTSKYRRARLYLDVDV